ncbi:hypothetical protein [Janthinobacterium sp. GW456W]|uniref:hypothetical protein n=1 Tax=Janthinobacterium sp. GW456W TaxID=1981505 RepID=UPI001557AF4A|nr:hypothetical protein [Janthinobacterium sp. GW456W]
MKRMKMREGSFLMEKVADAMADLRDIRSFPARGNDAATRGHDVSGFEKIFHR